MMEGRENYGTRGLRAKDEKHGDCKQWQKDIDKWRKANGLKPMYEKEGKND